ncbi:maleylacetoacetate isomerase [Acuticoccus mangrovi]|uniref:Maleylacetoacetate isomerase n=1 Tax=Acuticoccus mangrovi TaxID=2796142 RepID=A0A934MEA1_9HYPH|nr:maleylacetoacetate isomerase [Acuticoccus mangrovi]MBJ3774163.1 maleylacetoacetate isomerase [Acuticoccus mangrovi]
MILYDYWRSSAAYRVRIALNLLDMKYELVPVDLTAGEQRSAAHLARNPQGLVPALEIDGVMMTQSLAIIEYLDETRSAGFRPAEPVERAKVRAIAYAIAMDLHPICNLSVAQAAVKASNGAIGMKDWMHTFIGPRMLAVEEMLDRSRTGRFVHGDRPGIADICLVPQVYNARRWEVDLSAMPHTLAIDAEMAALPAVAAAHPDRARPG